MKGLTKGLEFKTKSSTSGFEIKAKILTPGSGNQDQDRALRSIDHDQ